MKVEGILCDASILGFHISGASPDQLLFSSFCKGLRRNTEEKLSSGKSDSSVSWA